MLFNNHSLSLTSDRVKLLSGGSAVFRARALLSLTKPNQHFDDRQICEPFGGIRIGDNSNSNLNFYKIYPNPSSSEVSVEFADNILETTQFILINTTGQEVLIKSIPVGQKSFKFNISSFDPGVYHYQLSANNKYVLHGKLVIIR